MAIKYLRTAKLKNKTVLLRIDVNVPISEQGDVADAFRIEQAVPVIRMLQEGGNRIVVVGHRGRPQGRDPKYTLQPVAEHLARVLGLKFGVTHHPLPEYPAGHLMFYTGNIESGGALGDIPSSGIVFLENIRFYPGEEARDQRLAARLAELADAYVNDAFSVDHHASVSVSEIPKLLPSYAGPLLERELLALEAVLKKPAHPFVAMMGGIKISDKVKTLENLGKRADKILIGGGLANLFFRARGLEIGLSKIEDDAVSVAWQTDKNFKDKILLPVDVVVADEAKDKSTIRACAPYEVRKHEVIYDCGPKTILAFAHELKRAKTIVWNGPLGLFEHKPFHTATMALARIIGAVATRKAYAVVGGGETVDAVLKSHQFSHMDHVSTGGGAMLDFLAGRKLPGVEALK